MDLGQLFSFTGSAKMPSILQTEASECGLASLAMIANWHGYRVSLSELRRRFGISLKGATLKDIIVIADAIGLAARPLRLELDELAELRLPCILHWDLNHFVVLQSVNPGHHVTIQDPAVGARKLSLAEVSRRFTGVAVEFTPTQRFEKASPTPRVKISQLLGRVTGLKAALAQVFVLALAIEVLAMIAPMLIGLVVDHTLVSGDRDLLMTLALAFTLFLVMQTGLSAMRGWMLMGLNASLKVQSRANLFSHLLELPTPFFEARHLGDVMSRFSSQEIILQTITREVVEAILDGAMAAITLLIMFLFAPDLALVVLLGSAIYGALRWAFYAPLRLASVEGIVWGAKRDTHFLETLRGIRTIKLFNGQEERRGRWLNLLVETINRQLFVEKLHLAFRVTNTLLAGLIKILVIWLGARKILDGGFSVGLLLAFLAYKEQFQERVSELTDKVIDLTMLRLHSERLSDIALATPEKRDVCLVHDHEFPSASIEVRNVKYRYAENEPWILDGISFRIEAGESVAIVGPSGGGKTTLLKILAGLTAPTEGEILINGEPLNRLGLAKYRAMIGVVMQDDQLFAGSIMDNICFFAERPDVDRVKSCAMTAAVHDDIMSMPMAYDTLIGDMGTVLSGGQKQRVLIARALYRRPAILLLDEATSHLDVDREKSVNGALANMQVTRIVVAHRPETIRASKRVIMLEEGGMVEQPAKRNARILSPL